MPATCDALPRDLSPILVRQTWDTLHLSHSSVGVPCLYCRCTDSYRIHIRRTDPKLSRTIVTFPESVLVILGIVIRPFDESGSTWVASLAGGICVMPGYIFLSIYWSIGPTTRYIRLVNSAESWAGRTIRHYSTTAKLGSSHLQPRLGKGVEARQAGVQGKAKKG